MSCEREVGVEDEYKEVEEEEEEEEEEEGRRGKEKAMGGREEVTILL